MPSDMSSSPHTDLARDQFEESGTALEWLMIGSMQGSTVTAVRLGLDHRSLE
jgi:hypothetical protein